MASVQPEGQGSKTERTVFIVDDDESVRKGLCRLLRAAGYKAEVFASATDYLERGLSQHHDVLILDVRMPGFGGLELRRRMISQGIHKPVIFMTAYDDPRACQEGIALGAVAFLRKPIEEQSLLAAIRAGIASSNQGEKASDA
jgi:FixJ family two-component response regulator